MNKYRRGEIADAIQAIKDMFGMKEDILESLNSIRDDEEEYLDNIPENLQSSERYDKSEDAISNLESAIDLLEDLDETEIVSYLNDAMN